jgi:TRAP-type C4-dicarboxylate transport system permease small subunit
MRMHAALRQIFGAARWVACIALAVLALLVNLQVIGRLFGMMVPAAHEVSVYLLAASTFMATGPALRKQVHIRVGLLADRLSPRASKLLNVCCHLIAVGVVGYLAYFAGAMVWESYSFKSLSPGLYPIPLWIPQLSLLLGMLVFLLALAEGLVEVFSGRSHRDADTESGPRGMPPGTVN